MENTTDRYNERMIPLIKEWLRKASHPTYEPLISVKIRPERLLENLRKYQKIAGRPKPVSPVLKSNAYGHGLIEVARIIESAVRGGEIDPVPFLIIDSYFEALALRARGISTPLLVVGYTPADTIHAGKLRDVTFTITSLEALRELAAEVKTMRTAGTAKLGKIKIHLKIDTGMNRQGILPTEINEVKKIIADSHSSQISLTGICSHLASLDRTDQIEVWKKIMRDFPDREIIWRHISATDGHSLESDLEAGIAGTNMTRLGLGLYLDTPVLSMETIVTGVKKIHAGDRVGYDGTFTAKSDMTIATIPVGYFEGLDRRLSNKGAVKIGNDFAPIIGRVSMNISTVDVSKIPSVRLGTKVTIISDNHDDRNSVKNMASECGTIPYEILVHIPAHLKRVMV